MSDPAYPAVSPYLMVKRGAEALDWYVRAFDAGIVERYEMDDGRLGHTTLAINGGSLMLSDEFSELQEIVGTVSPETLGGTTTTVNMSVDDVDAWFDRAIGQGASSLRPPQNEFYGRHAKLRDPFGHVWSLVGPQANAQGAGNQGAGIRARPTAPEPAVRPARYGPASHRPDRPWDR